jgi:hypothetical protein
MSVYPESVKIEMQLAGTAGAWTDVSEDVLRKNRISVSYGIKDTTPTSRVASTGTMTFYLDNSANNSAQTVGYYSPGHTNCRSGFAAGITVRLSILYDGMTFPKFYGRIPANGINISPGAYGSRVVKVEVRDYMEQLVIHSIEMPDFAENKNAAEVAALIIANGLIQPLDTEYNTTEETFNTVFDTTKSETKSAVELNKVCLSELGYAYIKHDTGKFEIFTIEGRNTRTTEPAVLSIPLPTDACDYLLLEDGGRIELEDGSGYLKLNQTTPISFMDAQTTADVQSGNNLYNYIQGISYNRSVGTAAEVLFSSTFAIGAGDTVVIKGGYKDPLSEAQSISAKAILPPGTADYWMNTARDKTGTVLTANFNIGTPEYGTNEVKFTVSNSGAVDGYAYVQAVGTAVRSYTPSKGIAKDDTSIQTHGKYALNLDMKYQDDPTIAMAFINTMINQYKDPVTRIESLTCCANSTPELLAAFLYLDIGKRITLQESVSGVNGDYFINGVSFEILSNDIIFFTEHIKSASFDTFAFWYVGVVGQSEVGQTTFVGF